MSDNLIVRIVDFCSRKPWLVLGFSALFTVAAGYYAARNFAINTDITQLISTNLPWRKREVEFGKTFPKQDSVIVAVVDGPTPELTVDAAERLVAKVSERSDLIRKANQSTGGEFFRHAGLLYLPDDQLETTLRQLSRSGALLGPLSADPSLRGVMGAIDLNLRAVQARRATLDAIAPLFDGFSNAIEETTAGRAAFFSWQALLSDAPPTKRETRQLLEIYPVLDFNALEPGEKPNAAIRQAVSDLNLSRDGVTVRLTGPVRIADEEFGTLKEGAALNGVLTLLAVILILWLALHSARIIFAVLVSLIVGLAVTAALGLAMVGALNPISIAFFVLFVGIGVDFGLQFSVGYRAERYELHGLHKALVATAQNTGGRLALAALATACGFLAFTPTAYRGLSELGLIAGAGMVIAFITSITVLPALLRLLNPPAEPDALGYAALEPVDRFLERNRIQVLVITLAVVIAGLPLLYWLRFDFNPMNLRSPKVESVSTYFDLRKDPDTAGRTIEILARSLSEADAVAKRVSALPEVSRTITLSNLIPEDQQKKLGMIQQTASYIRPVLTPAEMKPAPSAEETTAKLQATSALLKTFGDRGNSVGNKAATRLSDNLSRFAGASAQQRAAVETTLIRPLRITLQLVRDSLDPKPVTLASLPSDMSSDWKTADGRVRVSVYPKGDVDDTKVLRQFTAAVQKIAPEATGEAVGVQEAGDAIVHAFIQAAILALLSIAVLLWITLKRLIYVALTLFPLLLAGLVTLEMCVILNLPLNFANIIALPLLLGVGVAFKIYYIVAWREGRSGLLASSLTRAVFYSGLTTAVAFGSLWFSNHPGTSSMGELLTLSLVSTMAAAVLFQPLLMGPPKAHDVTETVRKPQTPLVTREHTL